MKNADKSTIAENKKAPSQPEKQGLAATLPSDGKGSQTATKINAPTQPTLKEPHGSASGKKQPAASAKTQPVATDLSVLFKRVDSDLQKCEGTTISRADWKALALLIPEECKK